MEQENTPNKSFNRREFLKRFHAAATVTNDLSYYSQYRWQGFVVGLYKETGAIDQEGVNRLVDYAIEHGVNYFDTAPVYCNGECERVTGIALSRHPRDKYYIAAKISNLGKHPKNYPFYQL